MIPGFLKAEQAYTLWVLGKFTNLPSLGHGLRSEFVQRVGNIFGNASINDIFTRMVES